jgi:hypothetical protein
MFQSVSSVASNFIQLNYYASKPCLGAVVNGIALGLGTCYLFSGDASGAVYARYTVSADSSTGISSLQQRQYSDSTCDIQQSITIVLANFFTNGTCYGTTVGFVTTTPKFIPQGILLQVNIFPDVILKQYMLILIIVL